MCLQLCACARVFIVFHTMCVTCGCLWPGGMRGERERVGGGKGSITDREGGEDHWREAEREREHVVIEMLKASRRQSVCSLSLSPPLPPASLSLSPPLLFVSLESG